jgi:RNA polymerase sigma-70 factor, ECF subfamily
VIVTDDDTVLVARVVADDDRIAFELLVRRHQSPLRNFLRRLTKSDPDRADDLAQETFIKAYRSIATYAGQARFATWLYRIAYTTFLNDQRGRRPETEFDETQHPTAVSDMEGAGIEADVDKLLRTLPMRQRAVFDLHYKKGMTHQEVALALDVPLGTVKSDLLRGQETLKTVVTQRTKPICTT